MVLIFEMVSFCCHYGFWFVCVCVFVGRGQRVEGEGKKGKAPCDIHLYIILQNVFWM